MVCESLINSDTLEWERTQLWALTFKLVRKIIGGVDYKVFFFPIIKSNCCQIWLIFQCILVSHKRNEVEAFIKSVSFLLYFLKEFKIAQCFPQFSAALPTFLKVQVADKLLWQVGSHQADSVLSCHRSYDVGAPFQWKGIEQGGVELRRDAGISWQREQILLHLGHLGHCHSLTGVFSTLLFTKTNSIHSLIVSHNTAQEFHSCRSFCFIQATLVIVSWKTCRYLTLCIISVFPLISNDLTDNYWPESWFHTKLVLRSLFWLFSIYLYFTFLSRLIYSFYFLICMVLHNCFFRVYVLSFTRLIT